MKTKTINCYSFAELSDKAKENAINDYRNTNVYYEWWEFTYEDAQQIGLKITGFDLDRNRHATGEFTLSAHEVAANIISNHGEMCDTFKTAQTFLDEVNKIQSKYTELEGEDYEDEMIDAEDEFLKCLLEDYSIILQKESEYLQSDEAIIENIEANEPEFDENGNII